MVSTHWTDVPRRLGACDEALDAAADYASFELFWRDCANPVWLIWAVTHGLVAMPRTFDAAVHAAEDVYTAAVKAAWDVCTATKAARSMCDDVTYYAGMNADCIRAAAEPFTLGSAWSQEMGATATEQEEK